MIILVYILLLILVSCKPSYSEYTIDDQYSLARARIDGMKEQLSFSFTLEKNIIHLRDPILFIAHFTNKTNSQIMLRTPQQSGVLDINHPNTSLEYSITPLDKRVYLWTPLSMLSTPYIFVNPVRSSEFEILDIHETKDINLELPDEVYVKQGETWVESPLPLGQYLINITYENLYIGYEVEKNSQTYFIDISSWVGQIDAEPVLLTIVP